MMMLKELLAQDLVYGNTVSNFALFGGVVFLTLVLSKVIQSVFRNQLKRLARSSATMLDDILLETLDRPLYWILLVAGVQISFNTLLLPKQLTSMVHNTSTVVITMFVTWAASNLISAMRAHYLDPMIEKSESKLDDQLVPIMEKAFKAALWTFAILIVFSNMGYDILSLLTGLGIGGLAIAMAAQETLSNVFGSITIFTDQPFQVGDLITVEGHTGIVEEVGLRTSRMKTASGVAITIPNSHMVAGAVINHSVETLRRQEVVLGLVYDTTAEELRAAMALGEDIVQAHPVATDASSGFIRFADCALEIAIRFGVPEHENYGAVCSEINLQIKEQFDAAGYDMAFPTMTLDGLKALSKVA
ncbi:MAG: mechanosensitive ion channel family protein [Proteobacteria bacterium]|nr:mechanosensitive ion channel family protein [Pseudomonadota bacterium]